MRSKINLYHLFCAFWRKSCRWLIAAIAGGVFLLLMHLGIDHAMNEESERMLYILQVRANSLAAALEGAHRFMGRHRGNLSSLMAEIGRQPGVAWLALASPDGRILQDSNPELAGTILYTPSEMAQLEPGIQLQGRFSIDEPDIYETWKIFAPARLQRHDHQDESGNIIFVALNAAGYKAALQAYRFHLWLLASLGSAIFLIALALVYYIRNYLSSSRKLRDTEAMARQVIQSYPAALITTDLTGKIIFRNSQTSEILASQRASDNLGDWGGLNWKDLLSELASGDRILERELEVIQPSGRRVPVNLSAGVVVDGGGKPAGYVLAFADIQEIKRLKHKLAESQRLSSMGKLASGLAHEIRNPLSSICGYACYLEQKLANDQLAAATARLLVEETGRINNVLTDLLSLSKEPSLNMKQQPLADILTKAVLVARPDADARQVCLSLSQPDDLSVYADKDKLLQALLNLLLNAIQATAYGGEVKLSADPLAPHSPDIPGELNPDGAFWRIQVKDTGTGLTEKELSQIFTPYFTTRAKGTGLGLTIARQIIEAHGGIISVTSRRGQGSVFSIFIPRQASE